MAGGAPGRQRGLHRRPDRPVVGPVEPRQAALHLRPRRRPALPGTTAPSESLITSVGSSSPRFGSISSRENVLSTAGAPSASAMRRVTIAAPMSYAMWRSNSGSGMPSAPNSLGNRVRGVVAEQHDAAGGIARDEFHGGFPRRGLGRRSGLRA